MYVLMDEQEEDVRNIARDFLQTEWSTEKTRAMETDDLGYSPEIWTKMADLGWIGMSLPEAHGGQGLPLTYTGLLLSEIGRHVCPVPFHSTVVAGLTIAHHGSSEQQDRHLPGIISGESIATFALQEESGRITPGGVALRGVVDGDDVVLTGVKSFVDNFSVADLAVVVLRLDGSEGEDPRDGIAVAVVDTTLPGISHEALVTTAKDKQSTVRFDHVRVPQSALLGVAGSGWEVARSLLDHGAALLCAQIVGATRRDMEMAVEYSKQRHAFGRPIGGFQSLQHMMADMLNATDGSELLTFEAIWRLSEGLPASIEVSQAKAFVSERCLTVCRGSQQIHGGIGFMMEFDLHLWYRRVVAWSLRLGGSFDHRARIEKALLDGTGDVRLGESFALVE